MKGPPPQKQKWESEGAKNKGAKHAEKGCTTNIKIKEKGETRRVQNVRDRGKDGERERERERYIYIYIEREREKDGRGRGRGR